LFASGSGWNWQSDAVLLLLLLLLTGDSVLLSLAPSGTGGDEHLPSRIAITGQDPRVD